MNLLVSQAFSHDQLVFGILNNTTDRREMILNEAESIGLQAYIIGPESTINLPRKSITDVKILRNGRIVSSTEWYPLPTVVYDFSFMANKSDDIKRKYSEIHSILEALGVVYMNPVKVTKICKYKQLYANLLEDNQIPHPETSLFTEEVFFEFLDKYRIVYLKPTDGNKGKGIINIVRNKKSNGSFDVNYIVNSSDSKFEKVLLRKIKRSELINVIEKAKKTMKCRNKEYIVQEGIQMIPIKKKNHHIRAYTLRSTNGDLIDPIFFGKIGGHRGAGGVTEDYRRIVDFVAKNSRRTSEEIIFDLNEITKKIHLAIESEIGEYTADLGHDLVISEEGEVITIETNLKSGQPVFIRKNGIDCSEDLFSNPMIIVHLLANQFERERAIARFAFFKAKKHTCHRI